MDPSWEMVFSWLSVLRHKKIAIPPERPGLLRHFSAGPQDLGGAALPVLERGGNFSIFLMGSNPGNLEGRHPHRIYLHIYIVIYIIHILSYIYNIYIL